MNWYLCEVTEGARLMLGAFVGKKVYCRRSGSFPGFVIVLDVVCNFYRRVSINQTQARKTMKIIKRLTDYQSRAIENILQCTVAESRSKVHNPYRKLDRP